jgi:hypothetical protein
VPISKVGIGSGFSLQPTQIEPQAQTCTRNVAPPGTNVVDNAPGFFFARGPQITIHNTTAEICTETNNAAGAVIIPDNPGRSFP